MLTACRFDERLGRFTSNHAICMPRHPSLFVPLSGLQPHSHCTGGGSVHGPARLRMGWYITLIADPPAQLVRLALLILG
eukprot:NODE_2573_length_580_cov_103.207156_g2201_i0.p2 GENE.NODE_2573_length_580_cov_103.207156_g2201_i0~~NODE_2573_length_580_cov_103.207156_g2201_i0.p2  ORF type:complete len:79 (-),score=1.81 NODE_2573_length_580_cov_103.207156_g2201_i0:88-324(-)